MVLGTPWALRCFLRDVPLYQPGAWHLNGATEERVMKGLVWIHFLGLLLKQQQFIASQLRIEAGSPKSRCRQGHDPSESSRVEASVPLQLLTAAGLPSASAATSTRALPVTLRLPPLFLRRILVTELGAHLYHPG